MTDFKFIIGLLPFALFACGQSPTETGTQIKNVQQVLPSYIIFGIFCGECSGHCATMYRYNMMGNSNTLFVDSTDSYFRKYGKIVCNTKISDIKKFQIVNKLVQKVPKSFVNTDKTEQTFGCPDCTDGCGIYFELGQDTLVKKFYIDYTTDEFDKGVKEFGESVKETIEQLNKKN